MASPEAEAILAIMRDSRVAYTADVGWPERRAALEASAEIITETPDGVTFSDVDGAPGARCVVASAQVAATDDAVILYLHGGGYVVGSPRTHERMVGHIVRRAAVRALLVDYRLAPEHRYPAALDDALSAYRWLLAANQNPARIIVGGDSAGGGLAIALLLAIARDGLPMPLAAFTMSPWTDLACTAESMTTRSDVDLIADRTFLASAAAAYLGDADPFSPYASPLWGDLSCLPAMLVQVGDHEVLLDDAERLVDRARAVGVDATLRVFAEMQHVFQMNVGRFPEADAAISEIADFVVAQLAAASA